MKTTMFRPSFSIAPKHCTPIIPAPSRQYSFSTCCVTGPTSVFKPPAGALPAAISGTSFFSLLFHATSCLASRPTFDHALLEASCKTLNDNLSFLAKHVSHVTKTDNFCNKLILKMGISSSNTCTSSKPAYRPQAVEALLFMLSKTLPVVVSSIASHCAESNYPALYYTVPAMTLAL